MNTWEEVEQQPEFGVLSSEDKASLHKDWHENVLNSLAEEDPEKVDAEGVNRFVATEKARNESLKTGQPFDDQAAQQAYAQQVQGRVGAQKQTMADLDELERAQFALKDAEGNRQASMSSDTYLGEGAKLLDQDVEAKKQAAALVESRFTPEQLQQAKEAKATLNGERPTAVLGSDLYTDPALVLDKDKYRAAVAESNASPEAKARAMADFTTKRKQVAEQALRVLRVAGESPLPGALDFPSWEASQPEDVRKLSPEDKALQYMRTMQGRGDFRKLTSAIGTGLLQGGVDTASQGLGVAAMVANSGELAKKAAEVSEGASTLEEVSKLEGDKQATGATTAGGAARLLTPMAATIAPAVLTGGGSMAVASGLSGLQTAGAQFPTTYKALIEQGVPEEQALSASRNAAVTSGLITTALTAAFGKTGAEAALLTGAGGKELVKSRLLATLKGIAKGSVAEIPEELLDEAASQVIEQRTIDPNKPVSQIVDEFAQTAPDLAMQIALLGGVGGGVGGFRGSTTTPGGAPTVPETAAQPAPDTDFSRRAAMEGATEYRAPAAGTPVQVEGITIANIPEGSPLTPEDVAEFAAEPDTMKVMARQGLITLPEIVAPVPGVDPAITEEMNTNIATSAALAPQTVEALKATEFNDQLRQQEAESAAEETRLAQMKAQEEQAAAQEAEARRKGLEDLKGGAARNAEVLREAAARLAGTEKGPDLGFPKVSPVTTETETPSDRAKVAGGSQSVQTEPAEGSIPAVTGDTVSTSDIASTAEIQPTAGAEETEAARFARIKTLPPSQRTDEDIAFANAFSKKQKEGNTQAGASSRTSFLAGNSATTVGKLKKALDQQMNFRGLAGNVGNWVDSLFNEGWRMAIDARGNRQFTNGSEALGTNALGKVGMNYADHLSSTLSSKPAAEIQPTQANEPTIAQPNEGLRDEPAAATEGARAGEQAQAPGTTADPVQREQPQVTNNVVVLNPADLEAIPEDLARAKENQKAGNERWQQAAASTEPISVLQLPDGRYRILDGHHRALNAIAKGEQIQAIVEKPWAPAVNEPAAFTAVNGQKVVGVVSNIAPNGKATVQFVWNGKDTSVSVPASQLSRPITSLADGPKYVMTQEQNTRKAGKHFPTAPGVHENFDFNKAFASMAEDTSLSKMYREVARLLSKLTGFSNVDLHVVADGRKRYAGEYSHHNGKSAIAVNLRQVARGNVDALGTILHEALHHVTMAKVHNPQGDVELDAVAAIHQLRKKAEKFAKDNGQFDKFWYELGSNEEFITGLFTRPDFQGFLASIPVSGAPGKFRSLLAELFRRIMELDFGKRIPAGGLLDQANTSILALFETPHRGFETGALEKLSAVRSKLDESASDAEYMAAVKSGDVAKQQAMVDRTGTVEPFADASETQTNRQRWVADADKQIAFYQRKIDTLPSDKDVAEKYAQNLAAWEKFKRESGISDEVDLTIAAYDANVTPIRYSLEDALASRDVEKNHAEKEISKQKETLARAPKGRDSTAFETGRPFTSKVYHATPFGRLNEFDDDMLGGFTGAPSAGMAHFFAGTKSVAESYFADSAWLLQQKGFLRLSGDQKAKLVSAVREELGDSHDPYEVAAIADDLFPNQTYDASPIENELHEVFVTLRNPLVHDFRGTGYRDVSFKELLDKAETGGHDGVVMANTYDAGPAESMDSSGAPTNVIAVLRGHPNQIKSADPITRDAEGNVIPLSQRFNEESNDTRFSLAENAPNVQTAVMFDGKPLVAANGVTHYDLLKNWIKKNLLQPYQRENADEANALADKLFTNEFMREHGVREGFMVNGEFVNRQEALQAIRNAGQTVPGATAENRDWLDSSDLASTPKSMVEDADQLKSKVGQALEAEDTQALKALVPSDVTVVRAVDHKDLDEDGQPSEYFFLTNGSPDQVRPTLRNDKPRDSWSLDENSEDYSDRDARGWLHEVLFDSFLPSSNFKNVEVHRLSTQMSGGEFNSESNSILYAAPINPSQSDKQSADDRGGSGTPDAEAGGRADSAKFSPMADARREAAISAAVAENDWGNYTREQKVAAAESFLTKWVSPVRALEFPPDVRFSVAVGDGSGANVTIHEIPSQPLGVTINVGQSQVIDKYSGLAPQEVFAHLYDSAQEEIIHVAHYLGMHREWLAARAKGSAAKFVPYLKRLLKDTFNQVNNARIALQQTDSAAAKKIKEAMLASWNVYHRDAPVTGIAGLWDRLEGDVEAQADFTSEMIRQLTQLKRQDFTTETGWQKFQRVLKQWLTDAINSLRGVQDIFRSGMAGDLIQKQLSDLEAALDGKPLPPAPTVGGTPKSMVEGATETPEPDPSTARTRAKFFSPRKEFYTVQGDKEAADRAFEWINRVGPVVAARQILTNSTPAGMTPNEIVISMGALFQGFTEASTDPSTSEDEKTVARATIQQLGDKWTAMGSEAAREMRQRGVQNGAVLQPIAPILAANEVLVRNAEKILIKQLPGGAEGTAPVVVQAKKKADAEADERLENIIARLMGSMSPKQTAIGALAKMFRGKGERDSIIEEVAKALMIKARGNVVIPERKTALANLVSSLKSTLAASVKGDKKAAPERTMQDLLTSAFVNQVSEGATFEEAWKAGRQKVLDMLIDLELDKKFHPAEARLKDLRAKLTHLEAGNADQQKANAAERAQLATQIADTKAEMKSAMDAVKAMTPALEAQRDGLMPSAPTVAFDPTSSKEAIGRAFEKAGYTAELATGLDKNGKRALSIKDALLNLQRATDAVMKVFDEAMAAKDAVTQNDWPQARAFALKAVKETLDSWQAQMDTAKTAKLEATKQNLLSEDSKALEKLVNSIRAKIAPDSDWSDILQDLPRTQDERLAAIKERVAKHEALKGLTPDEATKLAENVDKLWQRERLKAFQDELLKAGVLKTKTVKAAVNVASVAPELIRLMNLGVFNASTFREAIAKRFGIKLMSNAQADSLRKMAAAAWEQPQGVLRNKKLKELVENLQHVTDASWSDVASSYWAASVLSGLNTQFNTWLAVLNGLSTNLIQAGGLLVRGNGTAAVNAQLQWWKALGQGTSEALRILWTGDNSFTKRFESDIIAALDGEKGVYPIAIGERMWKEGTVLQKIPGALMVMVGRSMVAADHVNNTATTQGAMAVARAMNPELYEGKTSFTQKEINDARAQALQETAAGMEPTNQEERTTVSIRTREILNAGVKETDRAEASNVGDIAAFQNEPTGMFGGLYRGVKSMLGSWVRGLDEKAQDEEATKISRAICAVGAGSVYAATGTRFMRYGFNIGNEYIRYMPGSWMLNKVVPILGSNLSPMQSEMLLGKNLVGAMILGTLYSIFGGDDDEEKDGVWHLEGPWDTLSAEEKASRRSAGYAPNTMWIRKDGKVERVSYGQWAAAGIIGAAGSMLDEKRYNPEEWKLRGPAGHMLRGAVTGLFQVQNVAALENLAKVLGAAPAYGQDKVSGPVDRIIEAGTAYAGGFAPTFLKDLDKWDDPRNFKAEGAWEKLIREMPLARRNVQDGRAQFNRIGEDVRVHREPYSRLYTADQVSKAGSAYANLIARGIDFPNPSTSRKIVKDGKKVPMDSLGKGVTYDFEKAVALGYGKYLEENGERLKQMPTVVADKIVQRQAQRIIDLEAHKVQAKVSNP